MIVLLSCSHEFCKDCTKAHLNKLIDECALSKQKCPDYTCTSTFSKEEVKYILDEKSYQRFLRFETALEVEKDKDLFYCPNTKCEKVLNMKDFNNK